MTDSRCVPSGDFSRIRGTRIEVWPIVDFMDYMDKDIYKQVVNGFEVNNSGGFLPQNKDYIPIWLTFPSESIIRKDQLPKTDLLRDLNKNVEK